MGHFSIVDLISKNPKFLDWIVKSTFPDILVALGGFLIGKAIYNSYFEMAFDGPKKGVVAYERKEDSL